MASGSAVHSNQPAHATEDLQQQARDFRIPDFSPPWSHQVHPGMAKAREAADAWALHQFRTLARSELLARVMAADICTLLCAGAYNSGPAWGLEFAMQYCLFLFVLDDEVLAISPAPGATAALGQIFLELLLVMLSSFPGDKVLEEGLERILAVDEKWALVKRGEVDAFLARAVQQPGSVDYGDELAKDVSPITSSFRDLWKRAISVMPHDWSLRFAHVSQRDMFAMFMEEHEKNRGLTPNSMSEYIQKRREYGFGESALIVGELAEGIHVSSKIYYSAPMQCLVQATNDIICWHNDIYSFQKELLIGEVNLVHLISKREGCSYNRAAEIVNGMVVDRCKDLSLAAAELRRHSDSNDEMSLDSENAEKYILLCTNFISASHDFHQRSARFHEKQWANTAPVKSVNISVY